MRWIAENPPARGPGWQAYPLSRRILNWVKAFADPAPEILRSLAVQADYLTRSLEYSLLANHLFVNAAALTAAGCFFNHDRWLKLGCRILEEQIQEQILADGAHYERSPMYHALILEDLLDLMNLRQAYGPLLPDWSPVIARMLGWLEQMTHPDGEISFFNDAALGVAPPAALLKAYAARLGIQAVATPLGASGYVRLADGQTCLLFDAAPVGPDYQPGHAHADTLSFELSHQGHRVLVNSGTSTYENIPDRQRDRGSPAHNVLVIDARDSSEVWASFRVAARARPFNLKTDSRLWAEASHDGYGPCVHRRRIELAQQAVIITDQLTGFGKHRVDLFFHLHPGVRPECVLLDPALNHAVENTLYHPYFEADIPNQTVRGSAFVDLRSSVTFVTSIDLLSCQRRDQPTSQHGHFVYS